MKAVNAFGATGLFSRTTFAEGVLVPVQPGDGDGNGGDNNAVSDDPCWHIFNEEKYGSRPPRGDSMDGRGMQEPSGGPVNPGGPGDNPCTASPSPSPTGPTPTPPPPTPTPEPSPTVYPPPPPRGDVTSEVFYVFDERGNAVLRTDKNGAVLSEHHYKAFGKETTQRTYASGASTDPWGFGAQHGYYTDNETGYVYCTFRYYDPSVGRWLSRDPIGLGGGQQNLYAYCGGNPVMGVDPSGLNEEALKAAKARRYKNSEDAAIAFVYAVWDMAYRKNGLQVSVE